MGLWYGEGVLLCICEAPLFGEADPEACTDMESSIRALCECPTSSGGMRADGAFWSGKIGTCSSDNSGTSKTDGSLACDTLLDDEAEDIIFSTRASNAESVPLEELEDDDSELELDDVTEDMDTALGTETTGVSLCWLFFMSGSLWLVEGFSP